MTRIPIIPIVESRARPSRLECRPRRASHFNKAPANYIADLWNEPSIARSPLPKKKISFSNDPPSLVKIRLHLHFLHSSKCCCYCCCSKRTFENFFEEEFSSILDRNELKKIKNLEARKVKILKGNCYESNGRFFFLFDERKIEIVRDVTKLGR